LRYRLQLRTQRRINQGTAAEEGIPQHTTVTAGNAVQMNVTVTTSGSNKVGNVITAQLYRCLSVLFNCVITYGKVCRTKTMRYVFIREIVFPVIIL
jgi:hypothetical protein